MKKLTRNEMKNVIGGSLPADKPCSKCCDAKGENCAECGTGMDCNYVMKACPRNSDGTCAA